MKKKFKGFVSEFNNLKQEDINKYTLSKIFSFEKEEPRKIEENEIHKGYITSNSEVKNSEMIIPFYLNDSSLYVEFLTFLKNKGNLENRYVIFYYIQEYILDKFGGYQNSENNLALYLEHFHNHGYPLSITKFYQNNTAMSLERAAVCQNLLTFMNFESFLVCGDLNLEKKSFNIIKLAENKYILFDVSSPSKVVSKNKEDGVTPAFMTLSKIPKETITFNYEEIEEYLDSSYKIISKNKRVYSLPYQLEMIYLEGRTK